MSISSEKHGRAHPGPMRIPNCMCGVRGMHDNKYDAYYCPLSNVWLEPRCSDANCTHCAGRLPKNRIQ